MIAGCIDRIGSGDCAGCERRDACSELFAGLFAAFRREETPRPAKRESGPTLRNVFGAFLGEVAKAVAGQVEKSRAEAARRAATTMTDTGEAAEPARANKPPERARAEEKAPKPAEERTKTRRKSESPPGLYRSEVEAHLEPLLASGAIGIDSVARALGYSRQTLYRRLKAEGVTFEEVLDGLRRRLAIRFIEEGVSVKEAAYRLGFSDPAAFSRAFKRWTGSSPTLH